ncbi:MAG: prevent-host-death family protein [Bacteroidetes bacterium 4572_117]|nr:MAG: prevent-host-death family protein [Bacteroidetes bacterium 4572_117]
METIAVSDLRANITQILKEIYLGKVIHITSRGKVIAKIVPPDNLLENAKEKLLEIGKTAILHDILSPIDESWNMMDI